MGQRITIDETAFVTSLFRASDESISMDRFAKHWGNPKIAPHAANYVSAVSKYEPLAHCLRNRYFYEAASTGFLKGEIDVLINFGCGFSMYPFLLNESLDHIEIDMPHIIEYKKEQVGIWQASGNLPRRDISYIAADFISGDWVWLEQEIRQILKGRRSFILIEGVLFFLAKDDTDRLFNLFGSIQGPGEFIGSVSFTPDLEETRVFKKLIKYVEKNLEKNQHFEYQTLENTYYEQLAGYDLTDHQDTLSLANLYSPEKSVESSAVLNEHMYILKKYAHGH